jgi:2-hydroxy-6-oxonona-2,4-dienedioate hydrolase
MHVRTWAGPGRAGAPTVVLLHGIVSSRYLVPTARELARSCRVLAPDLPGFGRTPATGPPLSIPEQADLIAAWMAASGLEGSTVAGHSLGAQVAADLSARHPDLVSNIVLAGPTVDQRARSVGPQLGRWFANAPAEPPAFNTLATYEVAEIGPARMLRSLRLAVDDAIEDKLLDIGCPVLLVRGEHDRVAPQRWLEELRDRRPGSRVEVMAEAAHTVVYSQPVEIARLILDHVAGRAD